MLNSYIIRGLNHNGEFLQDLYRHPRFVDGDLNTNFIEKEYPDGSGIELSNYEIAQIAAVGRYLHDAAEQQDFMSVMAEVDLVPLTSRANGLHHRHSDFRHPICS